MECLVYYWLSLYVNSLNFPERCSHRRSIYSHFTAVRTEALRVAQLRRAGTGSRARVLSTPLCFLLPAGCVGPAQNEALALQCYGWETGAYRGWHFQGETRMTQAQPCEERWVGASEQLSWSWARKEGDREPQRSGESTPGRGQSGEVKETRPASLRLTPSPVLSSAYRRSVLAPSPDTDSECAVSQATVVMTEI